jgi:hypothetical protein
MREDRHELLKKRMFVYKIKDLEQLYSDMKDCWQAAFNFNVYLRHPGQPIATQMFELLCAIPQIQQEMDRLRSIQEDTPSEQP